jgi:hypothetical protein
VSLVIIAGLLSLIPFVYLLRLMTDARQLRERCRARTLVYPENARTDEGLLLELPYVNMNWNGRTARRAASGRVPTDAGKEADGPSQAA